MGFFKEWFKTKYKIVPVYTGEYEIYGYTVLSKTFIMWSPMRMYYSNGDVPLAVDNTFKTYADALIFLKHETTIMTDEEVSNPTNN